ncbi:MAG: hypothetical protein HY263_06935 [Chloroflexi bacterium]|nr:hypothetical protein [Chloroflexota bacterium]
MTDLDLELERELRSHYRAIDPGPAPAALSMGVAASLAREVSRSRSVIRGWAFAVVAAAAILVFAIVLGPSGPIAPPAGQSPSPSPAAASPSSVIPEATVPPVTTDTWARLDVTPIAGPQPLRIDSVAAFGGGYVAIGTKADGAALVASGWTSRDGRSWRPIDASVVDRAMSGLVVPCPGGVLAVVSTVAGVMSNRSTDGVAWTRAAAPQLRLHRQSDLAGNAIGVVGIVEGTPYGLAFSADGSTWQSITLPGATPTSVQAVAALADGFVALGESPSASLPPVAWRSSDGLHWVSATIGALPGSSFVLAASGSSGLVAMSTAGGTPGLTSYWTSTLGNSWAPSEADPLGIWNAGAGAGSANGLFTGDGNRLLGDGYPADGSPMEYWTSFDGSQWTRLAVTGSPEVLLAGNVTPFLLRDGILFSNDSGAWFGSASP